MRQDGRLSGVLHVLLHMAEQSGPLTSEILAKAMRTNPVVIRRMMAGLREHGYVRSEKGHGGGWVLARDLAEISLRDIYDALGRPALFAMGNRSEAPDCLVEQAINTTLDTTFRDAEALLLARFEGVTLAMLRTDVRARHAARHGSPQRKVDHVH